MASILIWNINQRAGYGRAFYPDLVRDRFHENTDILILTEFYKHSGWEDLFTNTAYGYEISRNGSGKNEILIAYNRERYSPIKEAYTWRSDYDTGYPDYLDIALRDRNSHILHVIGTRILVDTYDYARPESVTKEMKNRADQAQRIAGRVAELVKKGGFILGGGDLNTGRRKNRNQDWNTQIFTAMMPEQIEVIMPDGVSHEAYKGNTYAGCPDLLFHSRNIPCMEVRPYDWTFTAKNPEIYTAGAFTKGIPIGYPDHAQIHANYVL